jgi:hypothetical protein
MRTATRSQILFTILFWGLLFFAGAAIHAQGLFPVGGRGLQHLNAAWVQNRGQLALHFSTGSYYHTAKLPKSGAKPEFVTYWDVQGGIAFHFAATRRMEFSLSNIIYQDTHPDNKGANLPDDLFLAMKFGSFGGMRSKVKVGFMTTARIPLAKQHNIFFEPYSAGNIEFGVLGLLSYSKDVLIHENGFNFHLNLGMWHHNDVGKLLVGTRTDTFAVLTPSQAFLWGAGFAIPSHQFDFTMEVFGRNFLARPPVTAYSREDFAYLTPGVTYRPVYWAAINVGVDIRLTPDKEKTFYVAGLDPVNPDLPSYPDWRARLGARIALNRPAPPPGQKPLFVSSSGRLVPMQKDLEEQLREEKRKTETAEDELEKIRSERKRMESMLARLRTLLNYSGGQQQLPTERDVENPEEATAKENQSDKGNGQNPADAAKEQQNSEKPPF